MANRAGPQRGRPSTGYGEVQVTGLAEIQRSLKNIDPLIQKSLKKRLRKIAMKVRTRVQQKMPSVTGRARRAVKVGVTNSGAFVSHGNKNTSYTPWLDFGGRLTAVGGRHNTQLRPALQEGRYLYPAIAEMAPQTKAEALAAFDDAAREAGLK